MAVKEPANKNYFDSSRFRIFIQKLPNVTFFGQQANIPSINIGSPKQSTPFIDIQLPGEKMTFADLNITFKLDEQMAAWLELFTWMVAIGKPDNFDQYIELLNQSSFVHRPGIGGLYSDITVTCLTSAFNPFMEILYVDCWPTNLSEITLATTDSDVQYPVVTGTFKYQRYYPRML